MAKSELDRLVQLAGELEGGTVSLVGAGPGDSALVSIRGAVRLTQADVVLHDKLVGPELLDLIRPEAERIFVGKWRGTHSWTQDEVNAELVRQAKAGKRVVRLKGGDPFVFGRGGEECEVLAEAGVRYEVVPGVTAAFGAPVTAGIPLTHRGLSRSFVLVTGHAEPGDPDRLDFEALARMETIALYMGVKNLAANCEGLIEAGMDVRTPAAVIRWGTRPVQRTVIGTVGDIADRVAAEGIQPPALVLIGQVVRLRESIEWYESRPLHGQVVVVTRPRGQSAELIGRLLSAGADVIEAPTIAIAQMDDYTQVDAALRGVRDYAWLVLTSANGVDATFDRLAAIGADVRHFAGVKIAAVGSATAARLKDKGIVADLVPDEAVGEALAAALIDAGAAGQRVLLLRAARARREPVDMLQAAGATCDDLPVYQTIRAEGLPEAFISRLEAGEVNWITLTSPSTLSNLLTLLGDKRSLPANVRLASIGPVTSKAIRDAGLDVAVEADPHDVPGLVNAMKRLRIES